MIELTTVLTPILFAVLITLHAISPLLAINILSKGLLASTRVLRILWRTSFIADALLNVRDDRHDSIFYNRENLLNVYAKDQQSVVEVILDRQ